MTVWYVAAYAPPYQTVIYFFSLHVLGDYMPIIRRNNCIYATLDTCHSLWMTDMEGGMHTSHPHTVTNTKRRIDTAISPDDGHIVARNMYRKEINILKKKLCTNLALFTRLNLLMLNNNELFPVLKILF